MNSLTRMGHAPTSLWRHGRSLASVANQAVIGISNLVLMTGPILPWRFAVGASPPIRASPVQACCLRIRGFADPAGQPFTRCSLLHTQPHGGEHVALPVGECGCHLLAAPLPDSGYRPERARSGRLGAIERAE